MCAPLLCIKYILYVRWEYYSYFSLHSALALALVLMWYNISAIEIFTCNIIRMVSHNKCIEWAKRIATAINSKQRTKIRSKSINVYQYRHRRKRKRRENLNQKSCITFWASFVKYQVFFSFLKTFSFLNKCSQSMQNKKIYIQQSSK